MIRNIYPADPKRAADPNTRDMAAFAFRSLRRQRDLRREIAANSDDAEHRAGLDRVAWSIKFSIRVLRLEMHLAGIGGKRKTYKPRLTVLSGGK